MRCLACNVTLNDYEATRKDHMGFVDLCNKCYSPSAENFGDEGSIPVIEENEYDDGDVFDENGGYLYNVNNVNGDI